MEEVCTSGETDATTGFYRFDGDISIDDHRVRLVEAIGVVVDELGDVSIGNLASDFSISPELWREDGHVRNHSDVTMKLDQSRKQQNAYLHGYKGQIFAFVRCADRLQCNDPTHNTSRVVRLSREPYTDRERTLTHSSWIIECEKRGFFVSNWVASFFQ